MSHQDLTDFTRRDLLKTAGAGAAITGLTSLLHGENADDGPLPVRDFGRTGIQVPVLGLGTAPAGLRGRKEATELFHECLDRGVTYVDTAPEFAGYGKAQVALGDVLRTRRKEAFIVTKCWEADGEKALALLKSNLRELQTDHADVVYAHAIGSDKMDLATVLGPSGVLRALEKARRDGLVRFIGISGHNRPGRFLEVLREFDVQVMMNAVSFVSRHIYDFETKVWPTAHERGVALVAMKVFGGIGGGGEKPKGSRLPAANLYQAYCYAQSLPQVSTVVLGMHDREELLQNLAWARRFRPLEDAELNQLLARGKQLATQWGEVYGPVG